MTKILSAFNFSADAVYHCSMAQFEDQQGCLPEYIWSTLGPINQPFGHKLLNSPPIPELEKNLKRKKRYGSSFVPLINYQVLTHQKAVQILPIGFAYLGSVYQIETQSHSHPWSKKLFLSNFGMRYSIMCY